jgi:hypothetical protein
MSGVWCLVTCTNSMQHLVHMLLRNEISEAVLVRLCWLTVKYEYFKPGKPNCCLLCNTLPSDARIPLNDSQSCQKQGCSACRSISLQQLLPALKLVRLEVQNCSLQLLLFTVSDCCDSEFVKGGGIQQTKPLLQ